MSASPRAPADAQPPRIAADERAVAAVVAEASAASRVAVDLEASGYHAFRARICTVQLAWEGVAVVVDTLEVPTAVATLGPLLGAGGPVKIVHDVGFDARLLAEAGVELGHVHDTAVAARMLGRAATGLASLLESELGLHVAKDLQQHDWRLRPFDARALAYLRQDVDHLHALEACLWALLAEADIEEEVLEETRWRIESAVASARAPDDAPPYVRIKGVDRLAERDLAALRVAAELREREAERRDMPAGRVASNEALLTLAKSRPRTPGQVARVRGIASPSGEGLRFVHALCQALPGAPDTLPPEERARFERPRPPAAEVRALRERETRLMAWRRREAALRKVDEQVVLPGHCVKHLASHAPETLEALDATPGFGAFRTARYGEALLTVLRGAPTP